MKYVGTETKIQYEGKMIVTQGRFCVMLETSEGEVVIAIDAGKLVPENWLHERVRVIVEKL